MRGTDEQTGALFSYLSPDVLVPPGHPLRSIQLLVNRALEQLSPRFDMMYASTGRTSIAPEKLLRALLLQAFYGVRSERQLMEQIDHPPIEWSDRDFSASRLVLPLSLVRVLCDLSGWFSLVGKSPRGQVAQG